MPINNITQTVSTIPAPPHRGVDVQTQFVNKQEDFQDHLQGTTVAELNTLKTQINTTVTGMNIAVETINTKASEASTSATSASASASTATTKASTATTKASEASTSASNALSSENTAKKWADESEDVPVESGLYSAKHWASKASKIVSAGLIDDVTPSTSTIFSSTRSNNTYEPKNSNIQGHISNNTTNPHNVTKNQVGLSNVDNTSDVNKPISTATSTALNSKQATLVSGTNIKTINGTSILGSGDIVTSVTTINNTLTSTSTIEALSANMGKTLQDTKQATLVSGTTIKTVNGVSVLGSGDLSTIQTTITGNAGTATTLQTARTINGVSFNGSANITVSDTTAVKLTGNETIAGVKTFSSSPIVPTPTNGNEAVNKDYVDSNASSLPIGTILNGYTIFNNCIVAFGGEFNRAEYPKLWAYLQANPSLVKTQAQWTTESTANGGICGFFSDGNGTTTFRVPNLDKAFFRASNRGVGTYEADAFKSHTHAINEGNNQGSGAGTSLEGSSASNAATQYTSSAGGSETRPKNIAFLPLIVAK